MPHTFSTFTKENRRNPRSICFTLALYALLMIGVCYSASTLGMVMLYTFYFFWQQFHYAKQNFGIARSLELESAKKAGTKDRYLDLSFYLATMLVSLLGIFHGGTEQFFGYNLINWFKFGLPPAWALIINASLLAIYLIKRKQNYLMAIGHTFIFSFAYLINEHFALGWLCLNVFHNAQYLFFMQKREQKWRFLLWASVASIMLLVIAYTPLTQGLMFNSFPLLILMIIALNFTHYIVDSFIWKSKINSGKLVA